MRHFILILGFYFLPLPVLSAAPTVSFSKEVLPILAENCFQCHGPDDSTREANLRLDLFEDAIRPRDGYQVIMPGNVAKSDLINRILSDDDSIKMPPTDFDKHLSKSDIVILQNWIANGAPYEQHWSFKPVVKPERGM